MKQGVLQKIEAFKLRVYQKGEQKIASKITGKKRIQMRVHEKGENF